MNVVLYHKDADGFCAAAIAKFANVEGLYRSIDYGEELPEIELNDTVYMLDFCLQPFEHMIELNKQYKLIWIDHHKSALAAAARADFDASGNQFTATGLAGCELAWMYFHLGQEIPRWVSLVGRYDVWDHTDDRTIPFHYGLLSLELDPAARDGLDEWKRLRTSSLADGGRIGEILRAGEAIQRYVEIQYAEQAKIISFNLLFEGLNFIAFNHAGKGSKIADSIWDPAIHDAIFSFVWANDHWKIGLYTDKPDIDVSVIAVKYGGGGHKGAAGFQCKELPFVFTES